MEEKETGTVDSAVTVADHGEAMAVATEILEKYADAFEELAR